jgi:hypothetical protein
MIVYAVVSDLLSPTSPLGDVLETFISRENAEQFIDAIRRDDPKLASLLRVEERELEASALLL